MTDVIMIIVSKMKSYCAGTVQMREESESRIRKCEKRCDFMMTAEDGEGGQQRHEMEDCPTCGASTSCNVYISSPWYRTHCA